MRLFLAIVLTLLCFSAQADNTFIQPSSWGIPDDDHYNLYQEDAEHPCRIGGVNENASQCEDWNYRTPDGFVLRDCGYGGQCSAKIKGVHHAGIDYDFPYHQHDPVDYVNGVRKSTDLRQGKNASGIGYHAGDDIVASNDGVVMYANTDTPHGFGKTVIIRHICDPQSANANLCVPEGNALVIYTQYSHMSTIRVKKGMWVNRGQKIGEIGGSGGWIHHLHFEFKTRGAYDSPLTGNDGRHFLAYVKGDPSNYGYRNPLDFIGKVSVPDNAYSLSVGDICSADGLGWFQRLLVALRLADIACGQTSIDETVNMLLDTSREQAHFTSENPVFNGNTSATVLFQDAGISVSDVTDTSINENAGTGTPSRQPTPCTLKQDFDVLDAGSGKEFDTTVGQDTIPNGTTLRLQAQLEMESGNALDCRKQEALHTVDTDIMMRVNGGGWVRVGERQRTTMEHLSPEGATHTEHVDVTVNYPVGTVIEFRSFTDVNHDLATTAKSDLISRIERYTVVDPPTYNFITHSLSFLQAPRYSADAAKLRGAVANIGTATPPRGIRSSYYVQCPGTGRIKVADDGSDADELTPGRSQWEQTNAAFTVPNTTGNCMASFCADDPSVVAETNEADNCTTLSFTLAPRPAPKLRITKFRDKKGCCTTNRGKKLRPRVWVRNDGDAAPSGNVTVRFEINSRGTGYQWWHMGNGTIEPRELPPGKTDEDKMDCDGCWRIPKSNKSAWKKTWHTIRACVHRSGGTPTCNPATDSIATYWRYSKK